VHRVCRQVAWAAWITKLQLHRPISQRMAHYRSEADRLRRMAEAELIEDIRVELLAVAQQYQRLADGLKTGAPFIAEVWSDRRR
jgi:hypothetical protein